MKILYLTSDKESSSLNWLHINMHKAIGSVDYRRLSAKQLDNLDDYITDYVDLSKHDRIVFNLSYQTLLNYTRFLANIPNIVIIERDRHLFVNDKLNQVYLKFLKSIPWARVVTGGYKAANALQVEGVDAYCLPHGFDETLVTNENRSRLYEIGHVSMSKNIPNSPKKYQLIEELKSEMPFFLFENSLSQEMFVYLLNEIKFYVTAYDIFEEYGNKVFSATAAGCVVFAYNQGCEENRNMGFKDLKNIVLYKTKEELIEKLNILRKDPDLVASILEKGQILVHQRYTYSVLGKKLANIIAAPCRSKEDYPAPKYIFGIPLNLFSAN